MCRTRQRADTWYNANLISKRLLTFQGVLGKSCFQVLRRTNNGAEMDGDDATSLYVFQYK
jgi:hypothetical protein